MIVWLVKLEEPIPQLDSSRPYRMSMLASALVERGHEVVRWCSDFDHLNKRRYENVFGEDVGGLYRRVLVNKNYRLNLLSSCVDYDKPVSFKRLLNNTITQHSFRKGAAHEASPDLIICSMPTPGMAYLSSRIARRVGAAFVLDARDMWPDILQSELHGIKKILAYPLILTMRRQLKYASKAADACLGITEFFVDFLIAHADRRRGALDKSFALGFKDQREEFDEELALNYWHKKGVNLDSDTKFIYFAGRLNKTVFNAIDPVIGAAKELQNKKRNVKFVFCGSGQYADAVKNKCISLANMVFVGEIPPENLQILRQNSVAAIQPIENRKDYLNSLSNKFFESISAGLPVLTSLSGLTRDVVNENQCGLIYDSDNELYTAVSRLCQDDVLRLNLATNARSLFLSKFESSLIYGSYAEHLELILETSMIRDHGLD